MISWRRKEMVTIAGTRFVGAQVRGHEAVVILADGLVEVRSADVVVVPQSDDEIGVPALDQIGDVRLLLQAGTVVTDRRELNGGRAALGMGFRRPARQQRQD